MLRYLKSKRIYFEDDIKNGYLVLENSKIVGFLAEDAHIEEFEDYSESIILPGIIDTHNHGSHGWALMTENESNENYKKVEGFVAAIASEGVTGVFPTPSLNMIKTVHDVAIDRPKGARILGIHSEGPWLNRVGEKGVNTGYPEVKEETYIKMYEDAGGLLKLVAIAPEIEGSDKVISYFLEKGITMATAHSDQNYAEASQSIENGITVATHLANVMTGLHHRDIGVFGACITSDKVDCEIICDGIHVDNKMIKLMLKIKDSSRFMMISDSTHLAGLPQGKYTSPLGTGYLVIDENGFVKTDTGRLLGSSKSVLYGIKNLHENEGIKIRTLSEMASLNVARVYGFDKHKGSIKIGKDSDLMIINDNFEVLATYVEGSKVYDKNEEVLINQEFVKENKLNEEVNG